MLVWPPRSHTWNLMFLYATVSTLNPIALVVLGWWVVGVGGAGAVGWRGVVGWGRAGKKRVATFSTVELLLLPQ